MKRIPMLFALASVLLILVAWPAHAQSAFGETSIFNPSRLSVGARLYRSFDEAPGADAGNYVSQWWAGVPFSWEITSPKVVSLPLSIIGALDIGIPEGEKKQTVRGYVGVGVLLKRGGQ